MLLGSHASILRNLTLKEFKVRYKSAVLGFLWSLLNPLLMMLILSAVFSHMFRNLNLTHPYPVFVLTGLIPWWFFQQAVSAATSSVFDNGSLVKKVAFPRLMIPTSVVLADLIRATLSVGVLLAFLAAFGYRPHLNLVFVPLLLALETVFILGLVFITSSLLVVFRDMWYIVQIVLTALFYATPIIYPFDFGLHGVVALGERGWLPGFLVPVAVGMYRWNPMTLLIEAFRQVLLDGRWPDAAGLAGVGLSSAALIVIGTWLFRRRAPTFADYL